MQSQILIGHNWRRQAGAAHRVGREAARRLARPLRLATSDERPRDGGGPLAVDLHLLKIGGRYYYTVGALRDFYFIEQVYSGVWSGRPRLDLLKPFGQKTRSPGEIEIAYEQSLLTIGLVSQERAIGCRDR